MTRDRQLESLQALRLRLHRLRPSRPVRDVRSALAFIEERGIVLSTGRSSLPSLAEAIAGRQLRGSWMANPEVFRIYKVLGKVHRSDAVVTAPLILGRETLLDDTLGPAVARIAGDPKRRNAVRASLPPLAKRLLADVEAHGEVRMDRWPASTKRGREARLWLERLLLVVSLDIHTEAGHHTALVTPWRKSRIVGRFGKRASRLRLQDAQDQLIVAALKSAVIAPEREVQRWFVFGARRVDRLIHDGKLERVRSGSTAWLRISVIR